VDLSAEQQGNCALTEAGKIITRHDVTIIGLTNIPSSTPVHASQLYAKNCLAFLNYLAPEGKIMPLDFADEIINGALITHGGKTRKTL
jgi:NAD(P) transhydrogenase subunit alpha